MKTVETVDDGGSPADHLAKAGLNEKRGVDEK
jgi:hypothetical protein